ncbi:MAG: hypothetical protein Q9191_004975 [Dirinaria sp. TL-2023a]
MSGVEKFVFRTTEKDDPEVRQLAIRRANGWVHADGRSPIYGSPAVKAPPEVSRRQLVANDARIKPASWRQSRSESPAPEAAVKTSRAHDGTMPPPPRPVSRAEADTHLYQENEKGYDPFDTDIENADGTTTISDIDRVDFAQPFDSQLEARAAITQEYFADQSEYEESVDGAPNDGQQSSRGSLRHANHINEGDSDDDDSTDHGSDVNDIQHRSNKKRKESLDTEEWDAGYSVNIQTPNTREKIIKSVIDSPTTQKSLAVRIAQHEQKQPIQSTVVDTPRKGLKQSVALANPEIISRPPLTAEQKAFLKQSRKVPQRPDRIEIGNDGGQSVTSPVQTKQNIGQEVVNPMQPSLQYKEKNKELPETKNQLRPSDEEDRKFSDKDSGVHGIPMNRRTRKADLELDHGAVDAHPLKLDSEVPIEGGNAVQDRGITAALENQAQMDAYTNQTSGAAPKLTILPQPNKAEPRIAEPRKRSLELDYTREELAGMSYKLLNSESFDHIPKPSGTALPSDLAQASLADKLDHVYQLKDKEEQRRNVFASLSIEQYEETGDLILEKFASLLNRYKDARREKRDAARGIEKEVAQREERVRSKTHAVEKDLTGLKRGAEDVIRGKRS